MNPKYFVSILSLLALTFASPAGAQDGAPRGRGVGTLELRIQTASTVAWLGGHFPVGASAGFLVGPYVTRLDDTDDFGDGEFIVGIRFGMSVYL